MQNKLTIQIYCYFCDDLIEIHIMKTILIFLNAGNAGFSWQDVTFAGIICLTIFAIVGVLSYTYYQWKKYECDAKNNAAQTNYSHEDEVIKQRLRADLENKLLCYHKELAEVKFNKGDASFMKYVDAFKDYVSIVEKYLGFYTDKTPKEK